MKILLYAVFGLLMLNTMKDCEKAGEDHMEAKLGETIDIVLNVPVVIESEKLMITFSKNQDSRCPMETNCIRAGEAKATFDLLKMDDKSSVTLESKGFCYETDGSCGSSGTANGYTVKLLNVYPYPGDPKAVKGTPAMAKIVVTK